MPTVHVLPMHRTPWAPANLRCVVALRRLLGELQPDVVHGHSSVGGLLARVAAIRRPGARRLHAERHHAGPRRDQLVERSLRPLTQRFVAVSSSEADLAVALGLIRRDRVVVIPNGVEPDLPPRIDLRGHLGIPGDAPLVGTIARLVPQKAPEDFVAACAETARLVPDAHFVLIGGGELQAETDAAIAAAAFGAALPPRSTSSREPQARWASSTSSPWPPASRAGRTRRWRRCEPALLSCSPTSSAAATRWRTASPAGSCPSATPSPSDAAVAELLLDPGERGRLGDAGHARVAARFDVRSMGVALDALYAELSG